MPEAVLTPPAVTSENGEPLSKSEIKKRQKAEEKERLKAEKAKKIAEKEAAEKAAKNQAEEVSPCPLAPALSLFPFSLRHCPHRQFLKCSGPRRITRPTATATCP